MILALLAGARADILLAQRQPASLRGSVHDSETRRAIPGANVELSRNGSLLGYARSDSAGVFQVVAPGTGRIHLLVRMLGYTPLDTSLSLSAESSDIRVDLTRAAVALERVRVNGGPGLYGTIGRATNLAALAGARIEVVGVRASAMTDSAGRFILPIDKPGRYLLRVSRDGYLSHRRWIVIPSNAFLEASAVLEEGQRSPDEEGQWAEFGERVQWRRMSAALVPGAELTRFGRPALTDALRSAPSLVKTGLRIGESTCVFVDGRPKPAWPLDAFSVDEIEGVELYAKNADPTNTLAASWPAGAPCGNAQSSAGHTILSDAGSVAAYAVIWLKPSRSTQRP